MRNRVPISDPPNVAGMISYAHRRATWAIRSELWLATGRTAEVLAVVPEVERYAVPPLLGFRDHGGWCGIETGTVIHLPMPSDVLARAYAAMGSPDSAVALYERGIVRDPPHEPFPRYHYRLALGYERKGLKEKAIAEYENFLKIWGKADPVYKEPADARARLSRLKLELKQESQGTGIAGPTRALRRRHDRASAP